MGTNIYGALSIGKTAILAQQTALQVTAHNIANVNTKGYTRQVAHLETGYPIQSSPGDIGTGVLVGSIERKYDSFLGSQILSESGLLGQWSMKDEVLSTVEVAFNEVGSGGLSQHISDFFGAWHDLSLDSRNEALRQSVVGAGRVMSDSFNNMSTTLTNQIRNIDDKILAVVDEANGLIADIKELNSAIHEGEVNRENANDLRDTRDLKLQELSTIMNINTREQTNNQLLVDVAGTGRPLVVGIQSFSLSATRNDMDASIHDISWLSSSGAATNINSEILSGKLKGLLDVRDTVNGYLDKLNRVSSEIVRSVNVAHQNGYGLDSSTGVNFFDPLLISTGTSTLNTGSGIVTSAAVFDPNDVSTDSFELVFTSGSTFSLTNLTTGIASGSYTFTSGASMAALSQRGINMVISGVPAAGDVFEVSANTGSSRNFTVSSAIVSDSRKVAASQRVSQGDGANALAIADLVTSNQMGRMPGGTSGSFTFSDFYNGLVGTVGNDTALAKDSVILRESVMLQVENRREQVSGVSLDEEMINLVKFQAAYNGAARIISIVDKMLDTLLRS